MDGCGLHTHFCDPIPPMFWLYTLLDIETEIRFLCYPEYKSVGFGCYERPCKKVVLAGCLVVIHQNIAHACDSSCVCPIR